MNTAVKPRERRGTEMIKKCLLGMMRLLPLRKAFVLESHPDLSDNTYALYEELLRRGSVSYTHLTLPTTSRV